MPSYTKQQICSSDLCSLTCSLNSFEEEQHGMPKLSLSKHPGNQEQTRPGSVPSSSAQELSCCHEMDRMKIICFMPALS